MHGLVLAELAVAGMLPTWTLFDARSRTEGRHLGWNCSRCWGPADELPAFARRRERSVPMNR